VGRHQSFPFISNLRGSSFNHSALADPPSTRRITTHFGDRYRLDAFSKQRAVGGCVDAQK
jgi:hypothetical protein